MPGESILVVDDSVAVQELCRNVLESRGYRVNVASNGVAALSYPDLPEIDLLIIDTALRNMNGFETNRVLKTDSELYQKPVLLLVPEEHSSDRESQNLFGANAYLKKPFEPNALASKVQVLLEEKQILDQGRQHLRESAEAYMKRLADTAIQQAVEAKTQIIVERALQLVVTQVDQRARKEVDAKVTQLTAEKEQELVKITVHEVARSMVEKLAEKKVTEAMDLILREETEKTVRRACDSIMPGLARERVREMVEQTLPKEVQRRVQKEAESLVPDASQKVVQVIESAAQKLIPKIAKDLTGEVVERQLAEAMDAQLPQQVQNVTSRELDAQLRLKIHPLINEVSERIRKRLWRSWLALALLLCVPALGLAAYTMFAGGAPWAAKTPPPAVAKPDSSPKSGAVAKPASTPATQEKTVDKLLGLFTPNKK